MVDSLKIGNSVDLLPIGKFEKLHRIIFTKEGDRLGETIFAGPKLDRLIVEDMLVDDKRAGRNLFFVCAVDASEAREDSFLIRRGSQDPFIVIDLALDPDREADLGHRCEVVFAIEIVAKQDEKWIVLRVRQVVFDGPKTGGRAGQLSTRKRRDLATAGRVASDKFVDLISQIAGDDLDVVDRIGEPVEEMS